MKLNREQIVKALECCVVYSNCNGCPLFEGVRSPKDCLEQACKGAISLIKELKDEKNEVFEKGCENLTRLEESYIKLESENLKLTEENEAWQKELVRRKEIADKHYYDLACEFEDLRSENERLRAENAKYEAENHAQFDKWLKLEEATKRHHAELFEEAKIAVKEDAVRKMRSEIQKRCVEGGIYPAFVARTVEQVAKEMLGVEE